FFVGDKSKKDIKEIQPIVDKIKKLQPKIASLSLDELREKSNTFRQAIKDAQKDIQAEIQSLKQQADTTTNIDEKETLYKQIDDLRDKSYAEEKKALDEILPEAFAIIKETAKRFAENETLEVTATAFDRELSGSNDYVTIEDDKAIWKNSWKAAGSEVTWNMVIVNDYLAKRDSEWMGPIFEFHGLSVDCIDNHQPNSASRRAAYNADITYGTNNEFGFDYLRDNMAHSPEDLVQRPHHYAII